jgi:hypothetical protein
METKMKKSDYALGIFLFILIISGEGITTFLTNLILGV